MLLHTALDCHFYDSGGEISLNVFLRSLACARDDRTIECVILFHIYPFGKFTTIFVIIYRLPYFFIKKMRNGVVDLSLRVDDTTNAMDWCPSHLILLFEYWLFFS